MDVVPGLQRELALQLQLHQLGRVVRQARARLEGEVQSGCFEGPLTCTRNESLSVGSAVRSHDAIPRPSLALCRESLRFLDLSMCVPYPTMTVPVDPTRCRGG